VPGSRSVGRCWWRRGAACALAGILVLAAAPALRAAAPLILQPYADPDKLFTISYPITWHVRRANGSTKFYLDDPEEGTELTIIPRGAVKGEMDAAQVLKMLADAARGRYPDLKGVVGRQRAAGAAGTIAEGAFTWTNAHHAAMKGWSEVGAYKAVGQGRTDIVYEGYQAPASTFDTVEPVFGHMLASLRFGPGK